MRSLQQQQQPNNNIPSLIVNYTVTLASVSLYAPTFQSLQRSVLDSTLFSDTLMQVILQQTGPAVSSPPLSSLQLASTIIIIGPPLSILQMPTQRPTQGQTQIPLDEKTPFDLTSGRVSPNYVAKKTQKYFYSYLLVFLGIAAALSVGRGIYLLYLYICKPDTLVGSAAASDIYEPLHAPPAADTTR